MRIKLNTIKLENFKGLKSFEAEFFGRNAKIRAENGVGKTTILDAYLWLLFGKDSSGRTDFEVRPLDADNEVIKGLVVAVEASIEVGGVEHILRKEQQENVVKGQLRGYSVICTIDEVPKKVSEYQEWIKNVIPETIFKMLSDLSQFNAKMHWTDRRRELLEIAGKIPTPAGFAGLIESMAGKDIKDYEGILKTHIKAHKKERDGINPRIDELQRGLKGYAQQAGDSEVDLIARRENAQEDVVKLDTDIQELRGKEKERQEGFENINKLTVLRLHRESIVKNQSGKLEDLIDERNNLEQDHAGKTQALVVLQGMISTENTDKGAIKESIARQLLELADIKADYKKMKAAMDEPETSIIDRCVEFASDCEIAPDDLREGAKAFLADSNTLKQGVINKIEANGNRVKDTIDDNKAELAQRQDRLNGLLAREKALVEELKTDKAAKDKRIAEINEQIKNRPQTDPSSDAEWQKLAVEIERIKAELGEPVSERLDKLNADRDGKTRQIAEIGKSLAQYDNIEKSKARIVELEARERELAQLITEVEGKLEEIDRFKVEQSKMVEAAVNDRFAHVTWKLFKYNLNGSMDDTCEALLNGVPYPDMSAGQQLYCSVDCINTLSDHYGVEVPLFIDHAESMTLPIEATSQVIELEAVAGIDELEIMLEVGEAEVAGERKIA